VDLLDRMLEAFRRLDCVTVCQTCVKRGEEVVSRGFFGDLGLCGRCRRPATSQDAAFWVRA
jgi:hypothetical protein